MSKNFKKYKKNLWHKSRPKIKDSSETGNLKNPDINLKVISFQGSWVNKLYDENFHKRKVILLYPICITFGKHPKFHSNLS